jgi:hypothetical protein
VEVATLPIGIAGKRRYDVSSGNDRVRRDRLPAESRPCRSTRASVS